MKLLVNITRHDLKWDGFSINSINIIHMQIRYVHYLIINFISTMIWAVPVETQKDRSLQRTCQKVSYISVFPQAVTPTHKFLNLNIFPWHKHRILLRLLTPFISHFFTFHSDPKLHYFRKNNSPFSQDNKPHIVSNYGHQDGKAWVLSLPWKLGG